MLEIPHLPRDGEVFVDLLRLEEAIDVFVDIVFTPLLQDDILPVGLDKFALSTS